MQIIQSIGYIIFSVSFLNLVRIGVFSVLSDYYDIKQNRRNPTANRPTVSYAPLVSILVPAHNERLVIGRCLRSIYQSHYNNFEVILVDDGSADNTAAHAIYLRRKHHYNNLRIAQKRQNGGKASAVNYGLKYAQGSIIAVMDADCLLEPNAIRRAADYFKNGSINAVASNIKVIKGDSLLLVTQLLEYAFAYRTKKAYSVLNIEYLAGCTSFFRKAAIDRIGFYDEDTIAEDFDFSLKLVRRLGNTITYAEDVVCYTEGVKSVKDLFRQRFRWRLGIFQSFYKNRQMFFSRTENANKFLTWALLPWILCSEALSLIEPILLISLVYTLVSDHYSGTLIYGFVFYGAIVVVTILADEYIGLAQRLRLLLAAPLAYPLFMIINYIGYAALIKSLVKNKRIWKPRSQAEKTWISPQRDTSIKVR